MIVKLKKFREITFIQKLAQSSLDRYKKNQIILLLIGDILTQYLFWSMEATYIVETRDQIQPPIF